MENTEALAAVMYPTMKPEAPQKPAEPTKADLDAAKLYPTMAPQAPQKPVEAPSAVVEPSKVAEPAQATPEATAFAEQLHEKLDWIDAAHPQTVAFAGWAAEHGVAPDAAAKLVELDRENTVKAWDDISADWQRQARDLPEFNETVQIGNELLKRFGTQELKDDLVDFRFGNNPRLIAFLGAIGRAMKANRR